MTRQELFTYIGAPKGLIDCDTLCMLTVVCAWIWQPVIELEMTFPNEYPMKPPFVRVVRPRFKFLTGHITIGGSICMQVLTTSGWSPSNDIEVTSAHCCLPHLLPACQLCCAKRV